MNSGQHLLSKRVHTLEQKQLHSIYITSKNRINMSFIQQFKVLTFADNFDVNKIVFDKPRDEEVGGNKHIKGKRIKIGYMNNGRISELIIPTEKLHAYKGVRPTKPFGREDSDEIIGYNLPLALHSRDGDMNGRDRHFVNVFRQIIDAAKDYVISVKKQIGQSHLEKVMLYKWDNMLYEKKGDDGQPLNDFGPTLFAKLLYSREKDIIMTRLVDFTGKPLKLDEVLLKPADVIASIKFESIYVNSNGCSLQVKITEALVDVKAQEATESLLLKAFIVPDATSTVNNTVSVSGLTTPTIESPVDTDDDGDAIPVESSEGEGAHDEDDEPMPVPDEPAVPRTSPTSTVVDPPAAPRMARKSRAKTSAPTQVAGVA